MGHSSLPGFSLAQIKLVDDRPNARLKPPLKWAGGKRWLVPHLETLWADHEDRRFVEPFCGGLAATLGLSPQRAVLNDVNSHLIDFYEWLKKGLQLRIQFEHSETAYYAARERFNELIRTRKSGTRECAGLFYYLNRTGFNGLCRFNRAGEYNIPYGRHKSINYVRDFREYKPVMENWSFSAGDFENLSLRKSDFVYADPPYDVAFSQYAAGGFSWEDHERLVKWLDQHDGPVVISNHATRRVKSLYESHGYKIETIAAPRMISCTGDRTRVMEIVATKNV